MVFNVVMIIGILVVIGVLVWYGIKVLKQEEDFSIPENTYTIEYMVQTVADIFAEWQSMNVRDMNLSKEEALQQDRQRTELREALHKAGYGDRESKEYCILRIRDLMRKKENRKTILDIDEENINRVIHFDDPKSMKARDKFEIMLHIYKKKHDDKALTELFNEFDFKKPTIVNGETRYVVTAEMIDNAYKVVMSKHSLTYGDKLDILARRIFAEYKGFSAADVLFDYAIDEIDCGVSGIPKGIYEIKRIEDWLNDKEKRQSLKFTYQSIWIMLSALKIHLSFLEFDSQEGLVRVCQNIYQYHAIKMLSRQDPYVIGTMIDGSRIVVIRPEMSSSWAFFKRSFDSTPSIEPEALIKDKNAILPITIAKWIFRSYQNNVISGGMGTGKTTNLKSFIRFLPGDLAIRVFEGSSELNAQYAYPERNIVALQETEYCKMQEELNLGMKLNSDVTILGEMHSPESVGFYTQCTRRGSKLATGTIHTLNPKALIAYMRDSMPGFTDKEAAEQAAIDACRFDIHLDKMKDHRFCAYICEIVPKRDRRYPSEKPENKKLPLEEKHMLDEMEYFKRITDRELFEENYIVKYVKGEYVLCNMFSEETMKAMCNNLTDEDEKLFRQDMEMLQKICPITKEA